MLLEQYVALLNKSDFEGISELFTEDGRIDDGAARTLNAPDLIAMEESKLKKLLN